MLGLAVAVLAAAGGVARADDDYPNHAVRWLVGYPRGGSTDICARLIGQYLSERLHQQFAVENKPGAGNNLATEMAVSAPPDGYTVFLVNPANAINASLYKNLSFNFIADMTPVAGFIRVPNVMEANPNVPAHTVKEFIDYAKANPGAMVSTVGGPQVVAQPAGARRHRGPALYLFEGSGLTTPISSGRKCETMFRFSVAAVSRAPCNLFAAIWIACHETVEIS